MACSYNCKTLASASNSFRWVNKFFLNRNIGIFTDSKPTIINVNARSLNAEKVDELQVIVDDYDIDVACITETWFREYMDDSSLALDVSVWKERIEITAEVVE